MKFKVEKGDLPKLKGAENYREWKQGVQVLLQIYEISYLLSAYTPPTITINETGEGEGSGSTNLSSAKGKGKRDEEEEEVISKDRWERESKQVVFQLYEKNNQPLQNHHVQSFTQKPTQPLLHL